MQVMVRKICFKCLSFLLTLLLSSQLIFAHEVEVDHGEIVIQSDSPELSLFERITPKYEESNLRRGEIIFILSLPFTLLLSSAIVIGLNLAAKPGAGFDLPSESVVFIGSSAFFMSSVITYWDYKKNQERLSPKAEKISYLFHSYQL